MEIRSINTSGIRTENKGREKIKLIKVEIFIYISKYLRLYCPVCLHKRHHLSRNNNSRLNTSQKLLAHYFWINVWCLILIVC